MSTLQTSTKKSSHADHRVRAGGADRTRAERRQHGYFSVQPNLPALFECEDGCHFCAGPETD